MSKTVTILNGSPRPGGNTQALTEAFAQGVGEAGGTTHLFNLRQMKVRPCVGCYQCLAGKGSPCVQKDDMQEIYDAYNASDAIVFASPLYWWTFTAQLKTALDRLFAIAAVNGMKTPKKDCALLISAEGEGDANFAPMLSYYETCIVHNQGWTDRGILLAKGVNLVGDVYNTEYLGQARALGRSL